MDDGSLGKGLIVVQSSDATAVGRVIALGDELVVVGRDVEGAGVCLDDALLSRVHFRIAFDGRAGSHRVGDARSRNGTFVQGARIESAILRPGDVLRAGETVFVYGEADPMAKVRDRILRVASSDLSVLLLGETGTGKERLARSVHDQSGRSGPFVAINCAALPRELLAAELFGHTRGAFSGATNARLGLFQAADGGTLFLDEIGDFPADLQAVLLRALEESTVRPVGADEEISIDVRVVAATHARLEDAVRAERFRTDLYARLAGAVVRVPPLRERRSEVLTLAGEFARGAGAAWAPAPDAAEALVRYAWPFNVRELASVVRGFAAMQGPAVLGLEYLREHHAVIASGFRETRGPQPPQDLGERARLEILLARHHGNVSAVAEELGKPRAQLYRSLKSLGLDPARFREHDKEEPTGGAR
jgi:DNA-binding NtrC family response regulator